MIKEYQISLNSVKQKVGETKKTSGKMELIPNVTTGLIDNTMIRSR
jgi:hypothetical protein